MAGRKTYKLKTWKSIIPPDIHFELGETKNSRRAVEERLSQLTGARARVARGINKSILAPALDGLERLEAELRRDPVSLAILSSALLLASSDYIVDIPGLPLPRVKEGEDDVKLAGEGRPLVKLVLSPGLVEAPTLANTVSLDELAEHLKRLGVQVERARKSMILLKYDGGEYTVMQESGWKFLVKGGGVSSVVYFEHSDPELAAQQLLRVIELGRAARETLLYAVLQAEDFLKAGSYSDRELELSWAAGPAGVRRLEGTSTQPFYTPYRRFALMQGQAEVGVELAVERDELKVKLTITSQSRGETDLDYVKRRVEELVRALEVAGHTVTYVNVGYDLYATSTSITIAVELTTADEVLAVSSHIFAIMRALIGIIEQTATLSSEARKRTAMLNVSIIVLSRFYELVSEALFGAPLLHAEFALGMKRETVDAYAGLGKLLEKVGGLSTASKWEVLVSKFSVREGELFLGERGQRAPVSRVIDVIAANLERAGIVDASHARQVMVAVVLGAVARVPGALERLMEGVVGLVRSMGFPVEYMDENDARTILSKLPENVIRELLTSGLQHDLILEAAISRGVVSPSPDAVGAALRAGNYRLASTAYASLLSRDAHKYGVMVQAENGIVVVKRGSARPLLLVPLAVERGRIIAGVLTHHGDNTLRVALTITANSAGELVRNLPRATLQPRTGPHIAITVGEWQVIIPNTIVAGEKEQEEVEASK